MKILTLSLLLSLIAFCSAAQDIKEATIRNLENQEREAVLRSDSTALFNRFWSPTMIVNTPANRVGTVEGTKIQLRTGQLNYSSFERRIEKITFNADLAINVV